MSLNLILELLSAGLTVLVLLYIFFGSTPFFRFVSYSFVGVAAGYVLVVVLFQVIGPRLIAPLLRGDLMALVPILFGALLLFKLSPRLSFIGSLSMAIMVGVGAAVAIGGAVFGTIFGQARGTFASFPGVSGGVNLSGLAEGFFLLVGTICTLAYFQFGAKNRPNLPPERSRGVELMGTVGQIFIGIVLGATFAGIFAASISALIERIGFVINVIARISSGG